MNRYQKYALLSALILAFVIWLFPRWVWRGGDSREPMEHDFGYSFLFSPPAAPYGNNLQYVVEVDWQRQLHEWGTLAFVTVIAFVALRKKAGGS
jgi:hypothetical protein